MNKHEWELRRSLVANMKWISQLSKANSRCQLKKAKYSLRKPAVVIKNLKTKDKMEIMGDDLLNHVAFILRFLGRDVEVINTHHHAPDRVLKKGKWVYILGFNSTIHQYFQNENVLLKKMKFNKGVEIYNIVGTPYLLIQSHQSYFGDLIGHLVIRLSQVYPLKEIVFFGTFGGKSKRQMGAVDIITHKQFRYRCRTESIDGFRHIHSRSIWEQNSKWRRKWKYNTVTDSESYYLAVLAQLYRIQLSVWALIVDNSVGRGQFLSNQKKYEKRKRDLVTLAFTSRSNQFVLRK